MQRIFSTHTQKVFDFLPSSQTHQRSLTDVKLNWSGMRIQFTVTSLIQPHSQGNYKSCIMCLMPWIQNVLVNFQNLWGTALWRNNDNNYILLRSHSQADTSCMFLNIELLNESTRHLQYRSACSVFYALPWLLHK